ncbi:hypothetical protein D3C87_1988950 [compost metagenome]
MFTRGTVSERYSQNFAVIIEIIDSNGMVDVYDETVKEFGNKYEIIKAKNKAA